MFIHWRKTCKSICLSFHSNICYFQQFQQPISTPTPQKKQRNFHVANLLVSCSSVGPPLRFIKSATPSRSDFPHVFHCGFRCKEPLAKPMFVSCQASIRTTEVLRSWGFRQKITPLKTNECPLKRDHFNRKYIFQPLILRGHVSFPGSTPSEKRFLCTPWKINMSAMENHHVQFKKYIFMFHFPC